MLAYRPYHAIMSSGTGDVCGNCGAPLDSTEDGECRWCRRKVRARHLPLYRESGGWSGINWRWDRRRTGIAAVAVALAVGLGVGISTYVGAHQSGPPPATASGQSGANQAVPPGSTDLQALRQ